MICSIAHKVLVAKVTTFKNMCYDKSFDCKMYLKSNFRQLVFLEEIVFKVQSILELFLVNFDVVIS